MATLKLRAMVRACGIVASMLGATAATAAGGRTDGAHDISGMWWIENYSPILAPADGGPVPYTTAGRAAADKNAAAIADGTFVDPPLTTCLLPGLPRAMMSAYPMKIVQHDRSVTVIHEQTHAFWHAVIGIPHDLKPDDIDPAFMGGESVAKWEGDTLVIDSTLFKPGSYLDDHGMPHSEDLHLVQRLRKINGKELEAVMTIDDPTTFVKPWTARRTYEWRPDVKIMEYVCGEPKRVLTGDRAQAMKARRPL